MDPSVVSWHCALLDPGRSARVKFSLGWGGSLSGFSTLHLACMVTQVVVWVIRMFEWMFKKVQGFGKSFLVLTHTEHDQCVFQ